MLTVNINMQLHRIDILIFFLEAALLLFKAE